MAADLPFASSLCGACREVCPIKINIPDMLLELRHEIKEKSARRDDSLDSGGEADALVKGADGGGEHQTIGIFKTIGRKIEGIIEKLMFRVWAMAMVSPGRYRRATGFGRLVSQSFGSEGRGLPINRWTATRDLPPIAERPFRELWPELGRSEKSVKASKGRRGDRTPQI
jgi:L-lactate dehydrogenase complex protein LldF